MVNLLEEDQMEVIVAALPNGNAGKGFVTKFVYQVINTPEKNSVKEDKFQQSQEQMFTSSKMNRR